MSSGTKWVGANWRRSAIHRFAGIALAAAGVAGLSQAQSFSQYSSNGDPAGIASGPDGNLWFTERNAGKIGRVTLAGVVTEFSIPTAASAPTSIAKGADGNLWFTENDGNNIGRITTAGVVTEFPLLLPSATPGSIVPGPDGNLWFTELAQGKIGRITTAGLVTDFPTPSDPASIAPGSDGNLWFTERLGNHVDRITLTGVITQFPTMTMSRLVAIAASADGNLWFNSDTDDKIGRMTPAGVVTEFALPSSAKGEALTAGPDGNVWGTGDHEISRITPAGVVSEYPIPGSGGEVLGIVTGSDGGLWFTQSEGAIGRLSLGLCTSSATSLCLSGGRFQVRATWSVPSQGTSGQANAVPLTPDTGFFWFHDAANVEAVVKVLNGCGLNAHYWVFAGGLTNSAVSLTVTDESTGATKTYQNPADTAYLPLQDAAAFATCP